MKTKFFTLCMCMLFFVACDDRDDDVSLANIRIKNSSNLTFDRVQVGVEGNEYVNISSDDYSDYQEFEVAYTFNFIEIEANGETFVLQPIDFDGETPLPIGFYTYDLSISEAGDIDLVFVLD
ncbi:hypothetical protein U1E44_12120 [Arenibacter sp. GZD96]|uniref:hypothetical protein n=1 Tax=Aurantibrevibacter litoralis TaxID=3106030 RepID=UPI002AFE5390|nr:hypothetical protein [Arenibacter sp. GZD-96]MEA1786838.1 hypothetical protein [Arenibacter sp. GZD-96]